MKKLKLFLALLFLTSASMVLKAQFLTYAPAVLCAGQQVQFTLGNPNPTKQVAYYHFEYGDGRIFNSLAPSVAPIPLIPPGSYVASAQLVYKDSTKSVVYNVNYDIYNLPVPSFTITTNDTQCLRSNSFCIKDLSTKNTASPSNPLQRAFMDWGDGSASDTAVTIGGNKCHNFKNVNLFNLKYRVYDNQGCYADAPIQDVVTTNDVNPKFRVDKVQPWSPCFKSIYTLTNITGININDVVSFTWLTNVGKDSAQFIDTCTTGTNAYTVNPAKYYPDSMTFNAPFADSAKKLFNKVELICYKTGYYYPSLIIKNKNGCEQRYDLKTDPSASFIPQVIVIDFDVTTTRSIANDSIADSVCFGDHNSATICMYMKELPPPMDQQYLTWNFNDPNPPCSNANLVIGSWRGCHTYCGPGQYFPTLTVSGICPAPLTYRYYSKITFQQDPYIDKSVDAWDDAIHRNPNPNFSNPRLLPVLPLPNTIDTTPCKPINANSNTFYRQSDLVPAKYLGFKIVAPGDTTFFLKPAKGYDYIYTKADTLFVKSFPGLYNGTSLPPLNSNVTYFSNNIDKYGYGVRVLGPVAGIENPNIPIVISPNQKSQCGPADTVDMVHATSAYYKSRSVHRLWDFDDDYAPRCTSFSVPKPGWPALLQQGINQGTVSYDDGKTFVNYWPNGSYFDAGVGTGVRRGWNNALEQFYNSDHYFIQNGQVYPGRKYCRYSHDTLPRHAYTSWDTVYKWYRYGHDFMPWDFTRWSLTGGGGTFQVMPWDAYWWGKPVYLDILTGAWSLTQGSSMVNSYYDPVTKTIKRFPGNTLGSVLWPRIDTIQDNQLTDLIPNNPVRSGATAVPDPFLMAQRGTYVLLRGLIIDTTTGCVGKRQYYFINGNVFDTIWLPCGTDKMPNCSNSPGRNCWDWYEYVFRKAVQRCLTVRLILKDSENNESGFMHGTQAADRLVLDNFDCSHESTVQLRLGKADGYGLGREGKECPGSYINDDQAGIGFLFSPGQGYPGLSMDCGRSFLLFNLDSAADRKDGTPCALDAFTDFNGGTTPGGINVLPWTKAWDFNYNPPNKWTSPGDPNHRYHWGPNSIIPTNMPVDPDGWLTVGLAIGNGCLDTIRQGTPLFGQEEITRTVLLNDYIFNQVGGQPLTKPMFNTVYINTGIGPLRRDKTVGRVFTSYQDTVKQLVVNLYTPSPGVIPTGYEDDSFAVYYLFSRIDTLYNTPTTGQTSIKITYRNSLMGTPYSWIHRTAWAANTNNNGTPLTVKTTGPVNINTSAGPIVITGFTGTAPANYTDPIIDLTPLNGQLIPIPQPTGWVPNNTVLQYNFDRIRRRDIVFLGYDNAGVPVYDTTYEINYIINQCALPKCISDTVWYHNFLRIQDVIPTFEIHPVYFAGIGGYLNTSGPTLRWVRQSNDILPLYHKGETVTVHYVDSMQDSIRYSQWQWTDGTVTVDSFWYAGYDTTTLDGFYKHGIRRVRYQWDIFDPNNRYVIDSIVFPCGLPRTRTSSIQISSYKEIFDSITVKRDLVNSPPRDSIVLQRLCPSNTGQVKYPFFVNRPMGIDSIIVPIKDTVKFARFRLIDTALMFLPVKHKFYRTSWEFARKVPGASTSEMQHSIVSSKGCRGQARKRITIGWIDSLRIYEVDDNGNQGKQDTVFCIGQKIQFVDSLRYFRFDNQLTVVTPTVLNPGRSRVYYSIPNFPPNVPVPFPTFPVIYFPPPPPPPPPALPYPPYELWQFDTLNFWKWRSLYDMRTITHIERGRLLGNPPNLYRTSTWFDQANLPTTYQVQDNLYKESVWWNLNTHKWDTVYHLDTFYTERLYWDFGDGSPIDSSHAPIHSYKAPGRYRVNMISRDSCGWFDTCTSYVNVMGPVSRIFVPKPLISCGDLASFIDTSIVNPFPPPLDSIRVTYWWFGENKKDTITPQNIGDKYTIWRYKKNGLDTIKLVVETYQGCFDTGWATINVAGPDPHFDFISPRIGCKPFTVVLRNMADRSRQNPLDTFTKQTIFDWGDGTAQTSVYGISDTVSHTYSDTGTYFITVAARDAVLPTPVQCPIVYFPDTSRELPLAITVREAYKIDILASKDTICLDEQVTIYNRSDATKYATYGIQRTKDSILVLDTIQRNDTTAFNMKFDSVGTYRLLMFPTSYQPTVPLTARCPSRDTTTVVTIKPKASFTIDSTNYPNYGFFNTSKGANFYTWVLYKGSQIKSGPTDKTPVDPHWGADLKDDTGDYKVCLVAYRGIGGSANNYYCPDTTCKPIINAFQIKVTIPNVFTPNGDNSNDVFKIDIEGETKYDLVIFNRWGNKVFESKDKNYLWNGKEFNNGNDCPSSTYFFVFTYKLRSKEEQTVNGTVTLIRD